MMKTKLLCMLSLLTLAVGCEVPPEVRAAQEVRGRTLTNFLTNDAGIDSAVLRLWQGTRDREIAKTAEIVAQKVMAAFGKDRAILDKDGKPGPVEKTVTVAQAMEFFEAAHANIMKANLGTAKVVAKVKELRDNNAENLVAFSELEDAIDEYLRAGIDETVLNELTSYLVETITTKLGKDK